MAKKLTPFMLIAMLAFYPECYAFEPIRQRADALQGKVETVDIDPAGTNGSIGVVSGGFLRNVTCGNHFYVVKDNGTASLGGEHARWLRWYRDLCTRIARKWCEQAVIGNVQITAVLGSDRKFREVSIHASAPAVGRDGMFNNSPASKDACEKAAIATLRSMEGNCTELEFPPGLTAKAIVMSLTLSADADAVLPYPDLSPVALIPHDQKLQRLARTADILDTGWYVRTASFVRGYLPPGMREQLIGDHTHHTLDMAVDADIHSCGFGMTPKAEIQSLVAAHEDEAKRVLQSLIAAKDYVSAEEFAKRLVTATSPLNPKEVDLLLVTNNVYAFMPITGQDGFATIKFGGNTIVTGFKEARPNPPGPPVRSVVTVTTESRPVAPPAVSPKIAPTVNASLDELNALNEKLKDCYRREDWDGAQRFYQKVLHQLTLLHAGPETIAAARNNYAEVCRRAQESRATKSPAPTIQRGRGIVGFKFVLAIGKLPIINRVYPGTAAALADIQRGDAIESINGTSTIGLTKEEVYALITGQPGTIVDLMLMRNNKSVHVRCTRMDLADIQDPVIKRDYLISQ